MELPEIINNKKHKKYLKAIKICEILTEIDFQTPPDKLSSKTPEKRGFVKMVFIGQGLWSGKFAELQNSEPRFAR